MSPYIEEYIKFRSDPSNDHTTDGMFCGQRNWPITELNMWKQANPTELEKILATRRSRYADELIKIDAALMKKAKEGDARSIQLVWARFENWSPAIEEAVQKNSKGKTKTFADLMGGDDDT